MLFNSYGYLFFFLPGVLVIYFILNHYKLRDLSKVFLLLASISFYSYSSIIQLLRLIGLSLCFNYWLGNNLAREHPVGLWSKIPKKVLFIGGIVVNLAALAYFKYTDFFIANINFLFNTQLPFLHIALPLGISFFTFQEIAYLVDSYHGKTKEYNFKNYALFVTFFPQLIAGPIVHHQEMMPQFAQAESGRVNYSNIAVGLFILGVGLFKKVVIADTFAAWATQSFDHATTLTLIPAWVASLSYTLQLYFDFSGYSDMAIGAALMFNIVLPLNFNAPYRALDIQDFWRRWHITLTRFLRDYLYFPLGGNRGGTLRTCLNIFIVFLLGGIWHGAGFTFVAWGALHGLAMIIFSIYKKWSLRLPKILAWLITFNFINIAWVFFRANSFSDAFKVLRGMVGLSGIKLPEQLLGGLSWLSHFGVVFGRQILAATGTVSTVATLAMLAIGFLVVLFERNARELSVRFSTSVPYLAITLVLFFASIYYLNSYSEFIYFRF